MNINTIRTTLSFSDYVKEQVKCDNTAWIYKFTNSWSECDYWGGYISFSTIAQVYILDITYFPKGTKFKFPLPVKTYQPEVFSSYTFNEVRRPIDTVKDYIVGNNFTIGQDLNLTELKFYLTPDVKVPKSYVLNKYKAVLLYNVSTISIYGYSSVSLLRYLNSNMQFSLNTTAFTTALRYITLPANYSITITPTIYGNRYITSNANFSLYGSAYIQPNCKMSYWIRKFDSWRDCDTWS
ncbi:MAG: hypothetical protein JHC31_04675 [Sulfurihydrogenibium sp.]|jgi:hypothetical protein|nr:hypothetical protein [Sulfurihydrogenibium sp.]